MESFLTELYEGIRGPGTNESTRKAYSLLKNLPSKPILLDIGCGMGMQTIELAKISKGKIFALDINQAFLDKLMENAVKEGMTEQIKVINKSMDEMDFEKEFFDVIWAESSIFIMGFEKALIEWQKFLKKNGFLVVSDLVWLKNNPPDELRNYWKVEYPLMTNNKENVKIIQKYGYNLISYFNLPEEDWWEYCYTPLEKRICVLREKYQSNDEIINFLDLNQREIDLFRKYNEYYGYIFYIMQN